MSEMTNLIEKLKKVVKDVSNSTEKRAAIYSSGSPNKSHVDNPSVYNLNKALNFLSRIEDATKNSKKS